MRLGGFLAGFSQDEGDIGFIVYGFLLRQSAIYSTIVLAQTARSKGLSAMSRKAFLYRLYPSRTQARLLDATLETCRFFYKDSLAERKTA